MEVIGLFCLQGDLGSVADVGWWYQEVGRQVGVVIQSRGPGLFMTGLKLRVWSCTGLCGYFGCTERDPPWFHPEPTGILSLLVQTCCHLLYFNFRFICCSHSSRTFII